MVYSDKKSLTYLLQQPVVSADHQNWVARLMGFKFDVVYKPGPENKAADSLSRLHEEVGELATLVSSTCWMQEEEFQKVISSDEALQKIITDLQQQKYIHHGFSLFKGVLLYKNRLVMSSKSAFIPTLLHEFHTTPSGGHSGFLRIYRRLAVNLFWFGMKKRVQEFVSECAVCQRNK